MPVRVLKPELPPAEVHPAGNARLDHPLQRAVDRRAADTPVVPANERDQLVGGQVPALAQKEIHDPVAFPGSTTAGRTMGVDELSWGQHGCDRPGGAAVSAGATPGRGSTFRR
jgi:hypothetical protein